MAGDIGIENIVLGVSIIISGPHLLLATPHAALTPRVRIKVVHETNPIAVHELAQVAVALRLVLERRGRDRRVANTHEVQEDKSHLLEVCDADEAGDARGDGVEAVAVCGHAGGSPGLARQPAGRDEDRVAKVAGRAAELGAERVPRAGVTEVGDHVHGGVVRVGLEQLVGELGRHGVLADCHESVEILGGVDG